MVLWGHDMPLFGHWFVTMVGPSSGAGTHSGGFTCGVGFIFGVVPLGLISTVILLRGTTNL